jgi:hypothetical protein
MSETWRARRTLSKDSEKERQREETESIRDRERERARDNGKTEMEGKGGRNSRASGPSAYHWLARLQQGA